MPFVCHLAELGWDSFFEGHFAEFRQMGLVPARVVEELKGFHRVRCEACEYLAEIAGRARYQADRRDELPAVGDWVAVTLRPENERARIECILPRKSKLSRKVAGRVLDEQIVATNLDHVFVVTSLNRDFNLRRIERYLALIWESGARPIVLLNKADLCSDVESCITQVEALTPGVPVHALSALTGAGLEDILQYFAPGMTAALVGSSGVGKSTIINVLAATGSQRVQPVRANDDRGRHTTSSRQMIFLPGGGTVIDTPGMRELQLWDASEGVEHVFDDISTLAHNCRFRDCAHRGEPGCAVEAAIAEGRLTWERLAGHRKLQAELDFQQRKLDPRLARELKQEWKRIHKAMRKSKRD